MKQIRHLIFLSFLVLIGCGTEPGQNGSTQYIVKVDSISRTSFAAVNDTILIKLNGTIGGDGCASFSRFDDTKQPLRLDLTVWGQRSSANVCPAVMVYLGGKEYKTIATQQGWYSINIHQPDGTTLRDSIIIK
jgi:hypothetical protein